MKEVKKKPVTPVRPIVETSALYVLLTHVAETIVMRQLNLNPLQHEGLAVPGSPKTQPSTDPPPTAR